jgi:hypothetical protein
MPDDAKTAIAPQILLGCWELVVWDRADAAGRVTYPFTEQARGRIFYDVTGLMSAFLMHPDWKPGAEGQGHRFLSYSGRYSLDGDVVSHAVDMASDSRFVGEVLRRRIVPDGDQVVLETLASVGREAREGKHRLVWRRPA